MCCVIYRGGEYAGYVSFISFKCLMSLCESAPSHRHRAVVAAVAAAVAAVEVAGVVAAAAVAVGVSLFGRRRERDRREPFRQVELLGRGRGRCALRDTAAGTAHVPNTVLGLDDL